MRKHIETYLRIYVYVFSLLFSDFSSSKQLFSWHVTHVYVSFVHGFCWSGCTIARMIVVDNTLWYSRVLRPTSRHDGCTSAVVDFNRHVLRGGHWHVTMLPVRDGITILQRADRKKKLRDRWQVTLDEWSWTRILVSVQLNRLVTVGYVFF